MKHVALVVLLLLTLAGRTELSSNRDFGLEEQVNRRQTNATGKREIADSRTAETPNELLDPGSHEHRRRKALAELAQLGIPVTRNDPTTSDVPLSLKMEGGSVRTDFDPTTPLARGVVVDISDIRHSPHDRNPTTTTKGKLFLQLTMREEDQRRLFSNYPQKNYIPIPEDLQRILEYQRSLDLISIGMHDYNPDNTHLWPGVPHSYLYAPPGTPYDPDRPPVVKGETDSPTFNGVISLLPDVRFQ